MVVETHISRLDLIWFNLWALLRLRGNLIFILVVAVGIFTFIAFTETPENAEAWIIATVGAVVGGLSALLAGFLISLTWILLASTTKTGQLGRHIYRISEQGLYEETQANESTHKWPSIVSLSKSDSYIFIRINSYLFHVIPKQSFSNEQEFERFWSKANKYWKQVA